MNSRASCDKEIYNAIDILRSYGFDNQQALIDIMCRVIRTKNALSSSGADSFTLYHTMQKETSSLPRFP